MSAMNAASHCGVGAAQRRQPEQPERDRDDADEEADHRVAEEALAPTAVGVSTAAGISFDRLDPGRARDADRDRVVLDPVVRHDDRARAQPAERRAAPSSVYGTIASSTVTEAIVRSSRCGFVTRIRISPGLNSTRRMSNSSAGGGFLPDQVDERAAGRAKSADDEREQQDRAERPEPPAQRARAGLGAPASISRSTSKKPIQPSSVNSDWCAWNMNLPGVARTRSRSRRAGPGTA